MRVSMLTILGIVGVVACGSSAPQRPSSNAGEQTASYGAGSQTLTVSADSLAQGADGLFTIHYQNEGANVDMPIDAKGKVTKGFLTVQGVPLELVQSAVADAKSQALLAKSQQLQQWYRLQAGVFLLGVESAAPSNGVSNPGPGDIHIQSNITGGGGDGCENGCFQCWYECPDWITWFCCSCNEGCAEIDVQPPGLCSAATSYFCPIVGN